MEVLCRCFAGVMSTNNHTFLFASLNSKEPTSARKLHIRRLCDLLYLSIQRNDYARAERAWSILARCKEFKWRTMWRTAVHILNHQDIEQERNWDHIDFLKTMLRQNPEDVSACSTSFVSAGMC